MHKTRCSGNTPLAQALGNQNTPLRSDFMPHSLSRSGTSLAHLVHYRLVGPDLADLGRIVGVHVDGHRGTSEFEVCANGAQGRHSRIAWRDAVIVPERELVMVSADSLIGPERLGQIV